jgi:hypothetical protein
MRTLPVAVTIPVLALASWASALMVTEFPDFPWAKLTEANKATKKNAGTTDFITVG